MDRMIRLAAGAAVLFPLAIGTALAQRAPTQRTPIQTSPAQPPLPVQAGATMGPADTYFVTQTSLGTPFQVDAGRIAETKATTEAIRAYADLMVSSHVTVNNALQAILKTKGQLPPPTLLQAAYATMVATLQHERGHRLDRDYVRGQVDYQNANAALYKYEIAYGTDADLKAFARQTLPKIEDHLERALKLQASLS
jgi:putative membrane protein